MHAAEQGGIRPKHLRHWYRPGNFLRRAVWQALCGFAAVTD